MLAQIKSIAFAPNPGYSVEIISAQTLFAVVLAVFLFGSPLTYVKIIGIVLTLAGVALIAIER